MYVRQLPQDQQKAVEKELRRALGNDSKLIDAAMDSKLQDLEETININKIKGSC